MSIEILIEVVLKLFGLRSEERAKTAALLGQIGHELDQLSEIWKGILMQLENNSHCLPYEVRGELFSQRSHFEALKRFLEERNKHRTFSPLNSKAGLEFFETVEEALDAKGELYSFVHKIVYPSEPMFEGVREIPDYALLPSECHPLEDENTVALEEEIQDIVPLEDIIDAFPSSRAVTENDMVYFRLKERILEKRLKEKQELQKQNLERMLERTKRQDRERGILERAAQEREQNMVLRKEALQALRSRTARLAALAGDFRSQVALYKAGHTR